MVQNAVTGEHTCMILRPLNNEDIKGDLSDVSGFLSPFYHGKFYYKLFLSQCDLLAAK